jgi:SOS-response transcriptional repressor LexA
MFNKTLTLYREKAGIKKVDLARKVDVSLTYISSLESGKQKPPTRETCEKIAEALCLNDHETKELMGLAVMERMKSSDLDTIRNRFIKGKTALPHAPVSERPKKVPVLPWHNANKKITEDDIAIGLELVNAETPVKHNMFALRIEDASMAPEFQPHDIVIIDECPSPQDGDLILVADQKNSQPILRQYKDYGRMHILHPFDTHLKDIILDNEKRYSVVGKVVERIARTKKY